MSPDWWSSRSLRCASQPPINAASSLPHRFEAGVPRPCTPCARACNVRPLARPNFSMLRLTTFGGIALSVDSAPVVDATGGEKGVALLALLAESGDRGVERP